MRHISITGDLGSGKSSVARIICDKQPYEYFSTGALQRKLAAEKGMNTLDMNKMSEASIDVDKYIDDFLRNIEADKSGSKTYILDSRLAWHFVPSSFKVYLTVRPEIAAERVMNDHKRTGEPTTAMPAGAMFFCTPAKMTPYFDTSTGLERMLEDMSQTSGTPFVSGTYFHSVPNTVLFAQ